MRPSRFKSRAVAGFTIAIACALAANDPGIAQTIEQDLWATNGVVGTVVHDGGTIYIGGQFTQVGPALGGGVPLDPASGVLPPAFPRVAGLVYAVVADGAGGWYIGGDFTAVGGVARSNLAHITHDLTVSAWDPGADNPGPNLQPGSVFALVRNGATVYAGGQFTRVGGQTRGGLAAIDGATGALLAWNPNADNTVYALALSGSTLYSGGGFTHVGGQARNNIAAVNATTGATTAWNPGASSTIYAMAVGGPTLYVGGGFTTIGGVARSRIAAFDAATGAVTPWNPNATAGIVYALAPAGPVLYVGGSFAAIGGQSRGRIAALDPVTGLATPWNPGANSDVAALATAGSTVYAGGYFTSIGGQPRSYAAALDATTGSAMTWNPNPSYAVRALEAGGSSVYMGGVFLGLGWQSRNNIAALDATTGVATAWNPNPNSSLDAIAVSGATVYAGGTFTSIGGQTRHGIAALDRATGLASGWNPDPIGTPSVLVTALAASGPIYVGGSFTSIGGQLPQFIAALDPATGVATAWNPGVDGAVNALVVSGSTVYAAGDFTTIGGQSRRSIAALDAGTGAATEWDPAPQGGSVYTLTVNGSTVYAGGAFTTIGGQARNHIAALDAATGLAAAWNPNANSTVRALAVSGSTIYAGGDFTGIAGVARNYVAALDAATGAATSWDPKPRVRWVGDTGSVQALAVTGPTVCIGGHFDSVGDLPFGSIAAILADQPTPTELSLVSTRVAADRVEITWLAAAGDVSTATLYRRTAQSEWEIASRISADGAGRLVYRDDGVIPGTRYGYRLGVMDMGQEAFRGEVWVDVPLALKLSLAFVSNPTTRDLTASISLPDGSSSARLDLFDVSGRKLATRDVGALGAGKHVMSFGRDFPPGVYTLRLTQGERSVAARAVVLR